MFVENTISGYADHCIVIRNGVPRAASGRCSFLLGTLSLRDVRHKRSLPHWVLQGTPPKRWSNVFVFLQRFLRLFSVEFIGFLTTFLTVVLCRIYRFPYNVSCGCFVLNLLVSLQRFLRLFCVDFIGLLKMYLTTVFCVEFIGFLAMFLTTVFCVEFIGFLAMFLTTVFCVKFIGFLTMFLTTVFCVKFIGFLTKFLTTVFCVEFIGFLTTVLCSIKGGCVLPWGKGGLRRPNRAVDGCLLNSM